MCVSRKLKKKFFLNNFCVPEVQALKFLIQKENMVMQISVASPSSNFNSQKNFVKKLSVYFLAICANFPKLRSLN